MKSAKEVVETVNKIMNADLPGGTGNADFAAQVINSYVIDVAMMFKNIRETSISESDKLQRIEMLAAQTGISSVYISRACR
jgi:hypothetical protein